MRIGVGGLEQPCVESIDSRIEDRLSSEAYANPAARRNVVKKFCLEM